MTVYQSMCKILHCQIFWNKSWEYYFKYITDTQSYYIIWWEFTMYLKRPSPVSLLLAILVTYPTSAATLQNENYRVEITEDWVDTHPPGSLIEFYRFYDPSGDALAGMAYAGKVEAGDYLLSPGIFESYSTTEGVFTSPSMLNQGGEMLPVRTTFHYRLTNQGLNIAWRIDCDDEVTFDQGLHWNWDISVWDDLYGYNQVGQVDTFSIPEIGSEKTRALRAAWRLGSPERTLWVVQPDPLQARWKIAPGILKQEWLFSREAHTTLPASEYPPIASTLTPVHSIWGSLILEIGNSNDNLPGSGFGWIFLSGMPEKAEQGYMHIWDELPFVGETWEPMTTSSNPATPYGSKIVALLENHPTMKNVFILDMDKIVSGYPFRPNLPYWDVPQSFVCIDTLEQIEGEGALTVSHYTIRTTWVEQTISSIPGETLILKGWVRVDSIWCRWAGIKLVGDSTEIQPIEFKFTSPIGWTYCQSEIDVGPNTQLTVQVGMTGGPGKIRLDDLRLERTGTPENLLENAGFNDFSFNTWWDGEGLEWWHAHQYRRLATEAPEEYLEYLRLLESGNISYGWEDRVRLGMHAYHHTPNELYPLGGDNVHEFNFYDPEGDSARFEIMHRDLIDCGLTEASFKTMRFPGHRHQMPTVLECAKYGVRFIDSAGNYALNCLLGATILPYGVVWETNHGWWCDEHNWYDPQVMYPVLSRGELVLGGGHPLTTFPLTNPQQYEIINDIFYQLEATFPYMKYYFPDDFGDFCEESRQWWDVEYVDGASALEYNFYGAAKENQTIVAELSDIGSAILPPVVDYQPVDYEIRGDRIFIELPELELGYHSVALEKGIGVKRTGANTALPDKIHLGAPYPNPCNAWITFPLELPTAAEIQYSLTDILGRIVNDGTIWRNSGYRRISLNLNDLASGIYFYQIRAANVVQKGKITLLK